MTQLEQWIAEAHEGALTKKNSALPLNRRVKTGVPIRNNVVPPLTRFTRGTPIVIGYLEVRL